VRKRSVMLDRRVDSVGRRRERDDVTGVAVAAIDG
jgi:hypothetical protein